MASDFLVTSDEDLDGLDDSDDDSEITPDGYPTMEPGFAETNTLDSFEDQPGIDAEADLPPQEAYEAMKFSAPLSADENKVLERTPFLDSTLRWVDDSEHNERMMRTMKDGYQGMDLRLEDQMYGDNVGFSLRPKKLIKGIAKGVRGGVRQVARGAMKVASKAAHFVPGRDKQKAGLLRNANMKLINEHANWLQAQDLKSGKRLPRARYIASSKVWARQQFQKAGLPVSYSGANPIASGILGDDILGSWYNPFSWFQSKVKYVLVDTEGQRLAEMNQNEYDAYAGTKAAQASAQSQEPGATPDEEAPTPDYQPPYQDDGSMTDESGKLYPGIKDPLDGLTLSGNEKDAYEMVLGDAQFRAVGDDSLGNAELTEILGESPAEILGDDESGLDLYQLNPAYWFKSKRRKQFSDVEHASAKRLEEQKKYNAKRSKELAEAERAMSAREAADKAREESDVMEKRLQEIESATAASGIGGEEKVEAARQGKVVAARTKKAATLLSDKIERGEKLNATEVAALKKCLKNCQKLKALHRSLHEDDSMGKEREIDVDEETTRAGYPRALAAAREREAARKSVRKGKVAPDSTGYRDEPGVKSSFLGAAPSGQKDWTALVAVAAAEPRKTESFMKKKGWKLSPLQQLHLKNMVKLTRRGMAKTVAQKTQASGQDLVGLSWGGFAKGVGKVAAVAALPIAATSYLTYKGSKYVANKLWGKKGGGGQPASPAAANQQRLMAARQRRIAAEQRASAAQIQIEEAQRLAAEEAAATAAEADAATTESEAQLPQEAPDVDDSQTSGEFIGCKTFTAGDFVGAAEHLPKESKQRKIVEAASQDSAMGKKIRAGATLYKAAVLGNEKAKTAIKKMSVKAKTGNKQARKDFVAIKAGKVAAHAHEKSSRLKGLKVTYAKTNKKGIAVRRKLENKAGDKLGQLSRRRQLSNIADLERRAAAGDPRAIRSIGKITVHASKGDKKAKTTVAAIKLAQHVRKSTRTPRDRRNLAAAGKVVAAARRGDRNANRKILVIKAAADKGQPNAKRAYSRLKTAALIDRAVVTGKVAAPKAQPGLAESKKANASRYKRLVGKVKSGVATQEEALGAAKIAAAAGAGAAAGALAMKARSLPSAKQDLRNTATVAAAAQKGDPKAQQAIKDAASKAYQGDPESINAAGRLAAVKALEDHKQGQPMSPDIADATGIVSRARAGDPEAQRIAQRVGAAAQGGDKTAVEAAVALTAASSILAASAASPAAQKAWTDKAAQARGIKVSEPEKARAEAELAQIQNRVKGGSASQAEARRGMQLAEGLGRPQAAAQISAMMPPADETEVLTSLPDAPERSFQGFGSFVREGLKALLLATKDPFANYREGIRSRGVATSSAGVTKPTVSAGKASPKTKASGESDMEKAASDAHKHQDKIDEDRRRAFRSSRARKLAASRREGNAASREGSELSRDLGKSPSWSEGGKY